MCNTVTTKKYQRLVHPLISFRFFFVLIFFFPPFVLFFFFSCLLLDVLYVLIGFLYSSFLLWPFFLWLLFITLSRRFTLCEFLLFFFFPGCFSVWSCCFVFPPF